LIEETVGCQHGRIKTKCGSGQKIISHENALIHFKN